MYAIPLPNPKWPSTLNWNTFGTVVYALMPTSVGLKNSAPYLSVMIRLCATRSELTAVGPSTQSCPMLNWWAQLLSACVPVPAVSRFDGSYVSGAQCCVPR